MQKISEKIIRKKFPQVKGGILGGTAGLDPAAVNLFLQEILEDVELLEKRCESLEEQLNERPESETMEYQERPAAQSYETDEVAEEMQERIERLETLERSYKRMIYMAEVGS